MADMSVDKIRTFAAVLLLCFIQCVGFFWISKVIQPTFINQREPNPQGTQSEAANWSEAQGSAGLEMNPENVLLYMKAVGEELKIQRKEQTRQGLEIKELKNQNVQKDEQIQKLEEKDMQKDEAILNLTETIKDQKEDFERVTTNLTEALANATTNFTEELAKVTTNFTEALANATANFTGELDKSKNETSNEKKEQEKFQAEKAAESSDKRFFQFIVLILLGVLGAQWL